jgi:hypothetical protein
MQQVQKIEFRKEREFTGVLGDSIAFLKQNFKSLFSAILLIVGPVVLLSGLVYSFMQTSMLSNTVGRPGDIFTQTYFISIGVVYLLMLINSILLNSVVFNYMVLYQEKPAGEKITVSEVGARVWSNIGRVLGSMALLLIILIAIIVVVALIGVGFASMGAFGFVLLILAGLCCALIFGPVLTYYLSAGFFVVVRDNLMIVPAFGKVSSYMRGNFWWTWLILVVALIALSIVQIVFNLPATVLTMTETFTRVRQITEGAAAGSDHSVLLIIFYTLGRFLSTCSYAILHLICAFNFLSHEEKQEGQGILGRIEEIK